jgi:glycosyltransferase involved in cell wall biosynthesis
MRSLLEKSPYIRLLPRFSALDDSISEVFHDAHAYITFCYRDACPNAVVESMAQGLPVIVVASGGVPDIVGDAGRLVGADDFASGYFSAHRLEYEFPPIDYEKVNAGLQVILQDLDTYRARVQRRFAMQLDIDVVAENYAAVLRQVGREAAKSGA